MLLRLVNKLLLIWCCLQTIRLASAEDKVVKDADTKGGPLECFYEANSRGPAKCMRTGMECYKHVCEEESGKETYNFGCQFLNNKCAGKEILCEKKGGESTCATCSTDLCNRATALSLSVSILFLSILILKIAIF